MDKFIPSNEKSLFHFLCQCMSMVREGEIDSTQAKAVCDLTKEAEKLLRGERDRVRLLIQIDEHERNFGKRLQIRELAGKGFDDTTVDPKTKCPINDNGHYLQ